MSDFRMQPNAPVLQHHHKSRITGLMIASLVALIFVIVNFPYQYVLLDGDWVGASERDSRGGPGLFTNLPVMAGWPLKYLIDYPEDVTSDRFFSIAYLCLNVMIGVVAAGTVYGFIQWRHRQLHQPNVRWLYRWMLDASIALAIILVPGSILGFHRIKFQQHVDLAMRTSKYGNSYLCCWLPEPAIDYIPQGIRIWMSRVRWVNVGSFDGDEEIEEQVCRIPTLVGLSVARDGIRASSIESLADLPHFVQLGLTEVKLEVDQISAVSQLDGLVELSLRETNVNAEMLRQLDNLTVKSLDLRYTDFELSELGRPNWADTVIELDLSRPEKGESDSLIIEGWQSLRKLAVTRDALVENAFTLSLELRNLPALETVKLDRLQKHRLIVHDVPSLEKIDDELSPLGYMVMSSLYFPGQSWITELEIVDAPSLKEVGLFARDLDRMLIADVPSLQRFTLGSYMVSLSGARERQPADSDRCQQWIQKLGEQDGPATVDLQSLPLQDADLTPLAKNRRIRHLNLDLSGVRFDQLTAIAEMKQLETLDIRSCRLKQDELAWILEQFDHLESLRVDGSELDAVDLREPLRLKSLITRKFDHAQSLHFVDVPDLRTEVRMMHAPEQLEIRNAQGLSGLTLEQDPWPGDAELVGLRDLEWFGAGGPAVNDALVDELLTCRLMDTLTLAYADVSPDRLRLIGAYPKLRVLAVPGTRVDDAVTESWTELKGLLDVNLDDTDVGVGTLVRLGRIDSLRRLSLCNVDLDDAALAALGQMESLSQLMLAGVRIPPNRLRALFLLPELESLDVSGTPMDDSWVELIQESKVKHLVLRGSDFDPDVLRRILDAKEMLYVDLGELPETIDDQMVEELTERALKVQTEFQQGWQSVFLSSDLYMTEGSTSRLGLNIPDDPRQAVTIGIPRSVGRIDAKRFRPD
ncbi:MAG: hypothetical protein AAGG48_11905 [Planctomycetota bacterium]